MRQTPRTISTVPTTTRPVTTSTPLSRRQVDARPEHRSHVVESDLPDDLDDSEGDKTHAGSPRSLCTLFPRLSQRELAVARGYDGVAMLSIGWMASAAACGKRH
jgi:hypothetical protein